MYRNMRLHITVLFFVLSMSLPLRGVWFWESKRWGIEDFISKKCYEIDNEDDQQRCIAVKKFLLEARKQALEGRYLKVEAAIASIVCGGLGLSAGFALGIMQEDLVGLEFSSLGGCFLGLCAGPIHYKLVKKELEKTIPESAAFYAKCLQDKELINRMPCEVLDSLEYVPDLSSEEKIHVKSNIIRAWAAKEIADL